MDLSKTFNTETLGRELVAAVTDGDIARAAELLEKGASVDARDAAGNTPLMLAAQAGNVFLAGLLLGHGAEVDARNNAGRTALWLGANKAEARDLLLEFDADPLLVGDRDCRALLIAPAVVRVGKEKMLRAMLDAGMASDLFSGDGESLLMIAAAHGHEGMAALLIERGADVNKKDNESRTVLRAALKGGNAAIVKMLLAANADPGGASTDPDTKSYHTDLSFAATLGREIGAAVAKAAVKFELHEAATNGNVEKARALLASGVPADVYDRYGATALHLATQEPASQVDKARYAAVVGLLLAHGADPNLPKKGKQSGSPLHTAIVNNNLASVTALIKGGARTDVKDSMGQDAITSAEGWLEAEKTQSARHENRAEILRVLQKRRSQEIGEMARDATRLKTQTRGMKRASFSKGTAP